MFFTLFFTIAVLFSILANCVLNESCTGKFSANFSKKTDACGANRFLCTYTEQKWKRYTTIIYILRESIGQKVFTKA